jgi:hypothetical protein
MKIQVNGQIDRLVNLKEIGSKIDRYTDRWTHTPLDVQTGKGNK